jgi:O-antigen ligase
VYGLGGDELLLRRGFSYRLDIWQDAGSRLVNQCGIWLGCGTDEYRFLGRFEHPHSGYFAMLYRNGLLGGVLFSLFALLWLNYAWRARSRWLLLALLGWGSLLTTSNGVLTSPQPLWIYFWLPVFMAVLDGQRSAVQEYLQSRRTRRPAQS